MRLTSTLARLESVSASWLAFGVFDGEAIPDHRPAAEILARLVASKDLAGSVGETVPLHGLGRDGGSLLAFGLGKASQYDPAAAFSAGVAVAKRLAGKPRDAVAVEIPSAPGENPIDLASAFVEGLIVGTEGPGIRKAEPNRSAFGSLEIVASPSGPLDREALDRVVKRAEVVGRAVNLARELVNTPPAEKAPSALAQRARSIASEAGLGVEVWDRDRLQTERFGGVLAVSAGSAHPPAFVTLHHRMGGDSPTIALIGKGVTFDSGGLSLKPSASMEDMKCDMAGAAAVLAAMRAAALLKLPVNVTGYFALVENMTGGLAMKLGDVLTLRNGTTAEVLNTDAEGRLVLADVLSYAAEQYPSRMIDLATLTGACLVALGPKIAGLFSNDATLAEEVQDACRRSGERVWPLPQGPDFDDAIKSKVADIRNVGGKWGGASTAAAFLRKFVGETPWAHLDIAGPAWSDDDSATRDAGGTGYGVRTLVALLESASRHVAS